MNKLVGVLAVSTLAFAGATFYLANEVSREERRAARGFLRATISLPAEQSHAPQSHSPHLSRAHDAGPEAAPNATPDAIPGAARDAIHATFAIAVASTAPPALSEAEQEAWMEAQMRAAAAEYGAKLLRSYEDPREREKVVEAQKASLKGALGRFPQIAQITDEDADRLLTVLAQLIVERQVKVSRCAVDPGCSGPVKLSDAPEDREESRTRIAAVLGTEIARRYDAYRNSFQERTMVTDFRARLDDAAMLSPENAERLIEVLADERDRYAKELEQGGGKVIRTSVGGFPVLVRDGDLKHQVPSVAEAMALGKRLRERASQVLSADQMRVFDEMQEDAIASIRDRHRSLETIRMYESMRTSGSGK